MSVRESGDVASDLGCAINSREMLDSLLGINFPNQTNRD